MEIKINLKSAKIGDKFLTRSGDTVVYVELSSNGTNYRYRMSNGTEYLASGHQLTPICETKLDIVQIAD
jgi:hypothetical protein